MVTDSRYRGGSTRRRRKCRACGHVWSTVELPLEALAVLEDRSARLDKIVQALDGIPLLTRRTP